MAAYVKCLKFQKILINSLKHSGSRKLSYYAGFSDSLLNIEIRTLHCLQLTSNQLHTSANFCKRRKTAEEKKSTRIIEYSPKTKAETVDVWRNITLSELASVLDKDIRFVKELFLNQFQDPNTPITDVKVLQQGVRRSGHRIRLVGKPKSLRPSEEDKDAYPRPPAAKSDLQPRPPVVTVMGHVDHGKTTLLDALRHSSVVEQEFGGITQHIGAFSVVLDTGARITFLDTPGHAAFSSMRARGANLTDIVVLVVAADDGVMEQTVESIRMARQANVPILVAINKIDAPKADIKRTERMLSEVGIQVEGLGGDVQAIPISALKKKNLEQLTEALVLQADLLEIKADPKGPVEAVVVESNLHPHRGRLCTVVVQRGTLEKGSILVAGTTIAKVRALRDASGNIMKHATPGYPAEVEGWRDLPAAGEQVLEVESEKRAKEVIKFREDKLEQKKLEEDVVIIEQKREQHQKEYEERLQLKRRLGKFRMRREGPRKPEIDLDDTGPPTLNVILKADVDGTLEAILDTLDTYESDQCKLDLVHYGVGPITQNDVELASIFKAVIYAFNVEVPANVKPFVEGSDVTVKPFNVIYKLIDDVKQEINTRLPLKEVEERIGEAEVLQKFEVNLGRTKVPVAGCRCVSGSLKRSAMYRVIRNGKVIYDGPLSSMRHLKSEVDVIKADTECGIQIEDKSIIFDKGDKLICYEKKMVEQKTEWDPGF